MTEMKKRTSSLVSSATPTTTTTPTLKQHNFEIATFSKPTFCDFCSNFIWGLQKQGYSCVSCGFNAHKKCYSLAISACNPDHYHAPKRESDTANIKAERDLVQSLFAETQAQSRKLGSLHEHVNPALSIPLFLKNNTRFVARQGPMIWMNEKIIKLITWDSIPTTLIFLLSYIIICLNPILFAILPQCLIIYIIIKSYYIRADLLMRSKPLPKPHVFGQPPVLHPSFQEQKEALQNIQNVMGQVSDVYDGVYNIYKMLDWSDPELTLSVLYKTIGGMVASLVLFSFVKLNIILLVAGVSVLISNTAVVKALMSTLFPVVIGKLKIGIKEFRKLAKSDEELVMVVFENQRWWAGAGWCPALLGTERKPWSDETGNVGMESKDMIKIPTLTEGQETFEWDGDWVLDMKWAEVDSEGWQYYNQVWGSPHPSRVMGSFTRRRKWKRVMKVREDAMDSPKSRSSRTSLPIEE